MSYSWSHWSSHNKLKLKCYKFFQESLHEELGTTDEGELKLPVNQEKPSPDCRPAAVLCHGVTTQPYQNCDPLSAISQHTTRTTGSTSNSRGTCQGNQLAHSQLKILASLREALTEDRYDIRVVLLFWCCVSITAGLDCTYSVHLQGHSYWLCLINCTLGECTTRSESSKDNARASLQNRKKLLALHHAVVTPVRAPFPVIAVVHASGHVISLGVDLISACGIRYAVTNCLLCQGASGPRELITLSNLHFSRC